MGLINSAPSQTRPPLITFAGLIGLMYAYPLYSLLRRFPRLTLWATEAWLAPIYRFIHRSDQRFVARRITQWLSVPESQGEALAEQWMNHTIRAVSDGLWLLSGKPRTTPGEQSVAGREHLDHALSQGRGVLLVSLHSFGVRPANRLLRELGYPILSVRHTQVPRTYGRAANRWLGPRFEQFSESLFPGAEAVSAAGRDMSLQLARRLRGGGTVHVAADVWSKTAVTVPFLDGGQLAVSLGVLELARLCRCPVVPLVAGYTGGALKVELMAPLPLRTDGTAAECRRANLPVLVDELERQVRAYPDQWEKWLPLFQGESFQEAATAQDASRHTTAAALSGADLTAPSRSDYL